MSKVIVERPRWGGSVDRPRGRVKMRERQAPEDAPAREGIGKGRRTKGFNENLAPLKRYLLSQVGRRWDAVFAEISANLRLSSTVQRHVLQHLREMVIEEVEMDGKRPRSRRTGRAIWTTEKSWRDVVYVCPRTGILRRTPPRPQVRAQLDGDRVVLKDGDQLQRIGGVWYHVKLMPIPETPKARARTFDAVLGLCMDHYWAIRLELQAQHGRDDAYAAEIRPVGVRAVRALLPEDRR